MLPVSIGSSPKGSAAREQARLGIAGRRRIVVPEGDPADLVEALSGLSVLQP